jgi:hypothetical protein
MLGLLVPRFAHAQAAAPADLSSTIRTAILSDPRASKLTPEQLDQLVGALSTEAQSKGMTADSLMWHPKPKEIATAPYTMSAADTDPYACGSMPGVLCAMSAAFGFTGSSYIFPIILGVLALIMILVLIIFIEHHRHQKHSYYMVTVHTIHSVIGTEKKRAKPVILKPTPYLEKILRDVEKNKNNPEYFSGPFKDINGLISHLRSLTKKKK